MLIRVIRRPGAALGSLALFLLCACGGAPAPVDSADSPSQLPLTASTATAAPVEALPAPTASASAAPTAAPAASAAPAKRSGGPAVLKSDDKEITDTFGSSAAKLQLGDKELATLKIPEGALSGTTNLLFKINSRGPSTTGLVGKIYQMTPTVPPSGSPVRVATVGPVFELTLPLAGKKTANLAIGNIEIDAKGRESVKWEIVAPTRINAADQTAYFELPALNDGYLHLTTRSK